MAMNSFFTKPFSSETWLPLMWNHTGENVLSLKDVATCLSENLFTWSLPACCDRSQKVLCMENPAVLFLYLKWPQKSSYFMFRYFGMLSNHPLFLNPHNIHTG